MELENPLPLKFRERELSLVERDGNECDYSPYKEVDKHRNREWISSSIRVHSREIVIYSKVSHKDREESYNTCSCKDIREIFDTQKSDMQDDSIHTD